MARSLRFYMEKSLLGGPEAFEIQRRYPRLEWMEDYRSFRQGSMHREKECVIFARKRGSWLKPFHCYLNSSYRYLSLDVAEGCLFDCVYCYLQSYLNHGALVIFVDLDSLKEELVRHEETDLWISTGLLSDSLLSEKIFPVLPQMSQWIPEGSVLELRTKSDDLIVLKNPQIRKERVVVAWSLNPQPIVKDFEYRTSPLQNRLQAAQEAVSLGYRIAFHLDPVFHFDGWRLQYRRLFDQMEALPKDRIAFLSLGLFRYMPELGAVIRKRFPFHSILTGEFFADGDGKYHYLRAIRKEMYGAFSEWLQPWIDSVPVFWSMEPDPGLIPRS